MIIALSCAIALIGICLFVIAAKLCEMMDEQETERRLLESRIDSTLLLYQEHQKAFENRIETLEDNLRFESDIRRTTVNGAKKEAADAVKKEAALRQKEIESHKAETYLALYGKSFCGIPVVDPKNEPWTSGDKHGTK